MSNCHTARQASIVYIVKATLKRFKTKKNRPPGPQNTIFLLVHPKQRRAIVGGRDLTIYGPSFIPFWVRKRSISHAYKADDW